MRLDFDLVKRARQALDGVIRTTPVVPLSSLPGAWLKLECLQQTGSFKVRGPLALKRIRVDGRRWVTASAGNHGLGVAYASRFGVPPKVFVPAGSSQLKRQKIRALGADLQVCKTSSYDESEKMAKAWAARHAGQFVSPFDDALIMAANGGCLAWEILEQLPDLATLILPIGGGGLASGAACSVKNLNARVRLVGAQSERTSAMYESWRSGAAITSQDGGPTLADGLAGGVRADTYRNVRTAFEEIRLVSEENIARSMLSFESDFGFRIEGSAAVALSALQQSPQDFETPVVVLLTGRNVDDATWERARQLAARA